MPKPHFLILTIAFLATELRIPISQISFSLSELFLAVTFISLIARSKTRPTLPFSTTQAILFITFISATLVTIAISEDHSSTVSGLRNITSGVLLFIAIRLHKLDKHQSLDLYATFSLIAVLCALLGIIQSTIGANNTITIYDLQTISEKQSDRLTWILSWKLNNIENANIIPWQKSIAIGLHYYSNNFAEYLTYSLIPLYCLFSLRKIGHTTFFLAIATVTLALILTASRTAMIGSAIITLTFIVTRKRVGTSKTILLISGLLAVTTAAIMNAALFTYDGFGTLLGRFDLNTSAWNLITKNTTTFLFGGEAQAYYLKETFSPHNIVLYLILVFGLFGTIPILALLATFSKGLFISRRSLEPRDGYDSALLASALSANIWFLLYGMTWSVAESANSVMLWVAVNTIALDALANGAKFSGIERCA